MMPLPSSEQLNKNEDNRLLEIVRDHQKRIAQLERRPAAKTNFANAAGTNIIVGTGDPFDINNPFTGTAILFPAYADASGDFHIFGMSAGVIQWGANSLDGKIYFGGGDGWLDEFGLTFTNQEGFVQFLDTAAGETMVIYADGDDFLAIENSFGGTGVRFYIDDASHNVHIHTIDYNGIDLDDGAYKINGVDVFTPMNSGWIQKTDTWTRTGNHTYTVTGDQTTTYRKGAKIRYGDGGTDYGVIGSSVFGALTTINLIPNTDYLMAAGTITDTYISYIENPEGFPHWFNFAAAPTGFSAVPTDAFYRWFVVGRAITLNYDEGTNGTSNATTFTATAPVAPVYAYSTPLGTTVDNTVIQTTPGRMVLAAASTTITFREDSANGAWTNSGGKRAIGIAVYEF